MKLKLSIMYVYADSSFQIRLPQISQYFTMYTCFKIKYFDQKTLKYC